MGRGCSGEDYSALLWENEYLSRRKQINKYKTRLQSISILMDMRNGRRGNSSLIKFLFFHFEFCCQSQCSNWVAIIIRQWLMDGFQYDFAFINHKKSVSSCCLVERDKIHMLKTTTHPHPESNLRWTQKYLCSTQNEIYVQFQYLSILVSLFFQPRTMSVCVWHFLISHNEFPSCLWHSHRWSYIYWSPCRMADIYSRRYLLHLTHIKAYSLWTE